jgi:hypothetical protein
MASVLGFVFVFVFVAGLIKPSAFSVRRPACGVAALGVGDWRSAFGVQRLAVRRSAFGR